MQSWKDLPYFVFGAFILASSVGILHLLLADNTSDLNKPKWRAFIILGFVFWGMMFRVLSKEGKWKIIFGVLQMIAAVWLDWSQLGKIAVSASQTPVAERWALIAGGIVVFSKGISDVLEGKRLRASEQ